MIKRQSGIHHIHNDKLFCNHFESIFHTLILVGIYFRVLLEAIAVTSDMILWLHFVFSFKITVNISFILVDMRALRLKCIEIFFPLFDSVSLTDDYSTESL